MLRGFATLTLAILTAGLCYADEPVLRVQSIKAVEKGKASELKRQKAGETAYYPASVHSSGYIKDHFKTDANTVAALEFTIGGRVGINKNTDIEVVNERSVADGKTTVKRIIMKNGALWVKADSAKMKERLEIQTSGGIMGIKGTEFTVETSPTGPTEVSCFETKGEGVEIRDLQGKLMGIAKPGDEYTLALKQAPVVKHYEDVEKFREDTLNGAEFREMFNIFSNLMGTFGAYLPYGTSYGIYGANLAVNLITDPEATVTREAESYLNSQVGRLSPIGLPGISLGGGGRKKEPPAPDFPSKLSPDASQGDGIVNNRPDFEWKEIRDVDGYVVMVSKDEQCNEVVFSERTRDHSLRYGTNRRPLDPGKYYWRIIPVDEDDKPVKRASQTYFTVQ